MGIYNQAPYPVDPINKSRSGSAAPDTKFLYEYNGNLYLAYYGFIAATIGTCSGVYKSSDNGVTWTVPDGINSTWLTGNGAAGSSASIGSKIYWLHVRTSNNNWYISSFDMASDTYTTDAINTGISNFSPDSASLAILLAAGNDLIVVYTDFTGNGVIKYRRYSSSTFSAKTTIAGDGTNYVKLTSFGVDTADNRIHLAYQSGTTSSSTGSKDYYWVSISSSDSVSSPILLETLNPAFSLRYSPEIGFVNGKLCIASRDSSGIITIFYGSSGTATPTFSSVNTGYSSPVSTATTWPDYRFVLVGSTLYCFYINYSKPASTLIKNEIDYITSTDGSTWTSPVVYYDAMVYPAFPSAVEYPNSEFLHVLAVIQRSNGQFAIATTEENIACEGIFLTPGITPPAALVLAVADANAINGIWNFQDYNYVIVANTSSTGGLPIGNGNCPPFAINIGDQAFEFYGLLKPEVVEVLPVGKKFDQIGPVRFDKLGKLLAIRTRIITTESAITLRIHSDSEVTLPNMQGLAGDYSVSIPTVPYTDDVYEIKIPKTIKGTVFRIELGPNCGIFYRYDMQIKVQVSGMQSDPKWVKVG